MTYDLTDPTTRATVQEIRKQAIADAAYVVTDYLISEGKRSDCAPIMTRLASLADNPAKP
jgi:hypothetical protein